MYLDVVMPNITKIFNDLTAWMPDFMGKYMRMAFLFFCASAMITIVSRFVRFIRKRG